MAQMNCPSCGLSVSFKRGESVTGELCPRCLARSSGTISVRLRPGAVPKPLGVEARVRELLRKLGPSRTETA
jgi:hypothetical protein